MKIGAVVQARVASTRLPAKVLKELPWGGGVTVLAQVIRRLKRCRKLNDVVVALTTAKEDDALIPVAEAEGAGHFRGSVEDVLSRYYAASRENELDVIVRITSDCPCIDPEVVDLVVEKHLSEKADFTSNTLARTFPHGMDTEVMSFGALEKAHKGARQTFEREHVCPYIYKSNPQMFRISSVESPRALRAPDIRVTLDTEQDYTLLCAVFDYLYPHNEYFGAQDIIGLFSAKGWLKAVNGDVAHKKIFDSLQQELTEAVRILGLQELHRARKLLMDQLK